jgi:hypothetical protein
MLKQGMVVTLFSVSTVCGQSENSPTAFAYQSPIVEKVIFDDSVMLAQERHNYATNLAAYAANLVSVKKASKESLESARRILALALHLERRNKQAVVINFQLREGVIPEIKKGDYNPRTFARLLMTRAKLLLKSNNDNENERLLARCFIELAAHIDPRNEDAVFEYENQRIDSGDLDWRVLTDAVRDKPSRVSGVEDPQG